MNRSPLLPLCFWSWPRDPYSRGRPRPTPPVLGPGRPERAFPCLGVGLGAGVLAAAGEPGLSGSRHRPLWGALAVLWPLAQAPSPRVSPATAAALHSKPHVPFPTLSPTRSAVPSLRAGHRGAWVPVGPLYPHLHPRSPVASASPVPSHIEWQSGYAQGAAWRLWGRLSPRTPPCSEGASPWETLTWWVGCPGEGGHGPTVGPPPVGEAAPTLGVSRLEERRGRGEDGRPELERSFPSPGSVRTSVGTSSPQAHTWGHSRAAGLPAVSGQVGCPDHGGGPPPSLGVSWLQEAPHTPFGQGLHSGSSWSRSREVVGTPVY